jgi:autotransporter-associated beta strand protein
LTGGITSTTSNPGTIATIGTGTLDLNGAAAYSINVGASLVNGIDVAPWQAGLSISSIVQNGGITKTGNGLLQLAGQSTFAGGVTISAGGLVIGANSTGSSLLEVPTSGPVGVGTLTMANNTSLVSAGAFTISNNVVFGDDGAGEGTNVFNGTNSLTLNGITTLPSIWNVAITAPQMTVTIGDASPSLVTDVINKSGLGILIVGNYAGTISAAGGLVFTGDGNALGTPASVSLGGNVVLTNDTAVTVNRSGSAPNARNKILQKTDLTNPGSILSISNLSGFGLEFTGAITLNGASHFAVGTATASNVVPGLTLSGVVADAGGYDLTKSGAGTLLLTNASNTFGGATATIDVLAGVLAASSDGALGNSGNKVRLNVDGTTDLGFRATGTFASARSFVLNQPNNAFEVTSGNTLTLSTAFTLSATTNTLTKNDNGILVLTASNPTWASTITVAGGALRIGHSTALGTSTLTTSGAGSVAYELTGGVNVTNALTLPTANGATGIDGRGVVSSFSGSNTFSGLITQASGVGATFGAASGASLTIAGGISTINSTILNAVASDSVINLASTITGGGPGTNVIGLGTLNITVNQSAFTGAFNVYRGTVNLGGSGVTLGSSGGLALYGGVFNVSDATGASTSRLVNRALTLQGGTFAYAGNSANSAETNTSALTFGRSGGIFSSSQAGSGTVSLTFASLSLGTDTSAGFTGANLGTATNKILFTTAPTLVPATTGILPRATVNGSSFATYNATTGVTAFSAYNATNATNLNTAGATDTVDANAAMTTKALTANKTVNAVRFSGVTAQTVSGTAFTTLTLTSGGLLATGASTHVLSAPVVALAGVQGVFHADTGSTLSISSTITGTAGLVKEGAGTVVLSAPGNKSGVAGISANTLTGNLTVARGTLRLGSANAYAPGQFLVMGGSAATLDLAGFNQQFAGLLTDVGSNPGTGGNITSSSGTGQVVINQDNTARNWAGTTSGAVNWVRSGQNTLTVVSANAHTGTTLINGNTTVLQSDGAFSGISSLEVNYATLNLDNDAGIGGSADRIADAAAITFRGAGMTYTGRRQSASTETFGAVSVAQGYSALTATTGGTGLNSVDLTLTSLSRPASSAATFNVSGTNLGTIGSNSRVTVGTLNGTAVSATAYSANGNGLTNNLIGPWAIVGNEFATYVPGLGIAALNQTGAAQYDQTNTFTGGTASENVRLTSTTTIPSGGSNVNSVTMTGSNIALNFAVATDLLNLTSGGLIGPNNNQSIGAAVDSGRITVGGATPAANTDLYLYNRANTLTVNSRLVDNASGSGSSLRVVLTASGGSINLVNTAASYTGGTVINGGTVNLLASASGVTVPLAAIAANGLTINNATVTMGSSANTVAGQIAAGNIVTMNGVGNLNLFGDNTLTGLVLNNTGGGSGNLQVNTFSTATAAGTGATGVLTIGQSGITATSSNIASQTIVVGRVDFGATAKTIDVAPIAANGVAVSPLIAGLQLQGIVGSAGGLTKTGNGVLQFNAQAHYAGATTVNAGAIRTGVTYGGSRYSALTLAANTYLNLNGSTTVWGSLAGAGKVMNSSTSAATLVVGLDGSSTVFSGQLTRFTDATLAAVALQKVGAGQLTMSSAQDFTTGTTGAITVNGGTLRYVDAGEAFNGTAASGGVTFNLNAGSTIALDNSGTANVNSRLGLDVIGTLAIQGGKLTLGGSATASTTETITTFNVTNGGGRIELTPNAANPLTLAIGTLSSGNGHGGLVIGGITGVASANGVANVTITTPSLIAGQGAGANGTTTMSVRHDILADASATGLGTGFLVKDSVTNNYRALASGELNTVVTTWAATQNAGLSSSQTILGQTTANTMTISGTATLASGLNATIFGSYGPSGSLLTQTLSNASATLVLAGATGNINVGAYQSATTGTTPFLHVLTGGTLNMNAALAIGGTVGIAKLDGGTLNLNRRAYYTGTTTVNGGTLNLASGAANTIIVVPTATNATVSALSVNGLDAVVNLSNQAQAFGTLNSINPLPGQGGTITNSGGSVVAFTTSTQAASGTFAGAITGNLAFTKSGANTLTLTGAQTFVGETVVRGGTLELRDSATLASTAGLKLFYGSLNWNNFGHNPSATPSPTRIAASNAVTMRGGSFFVNGAGSTDTVLTLNSVTSESGNNYFAVAPYINEGSTVKVTIGNLARNASSRSGVTISGWSTNNSSAGNNTLGGQGLTTNSNVFITNLNGVAFSAASLADNLIGGWAVADGSTFASYSNIFGVVAMGNTYGGYVSPAFDGDLTSTLTNTKNIGDTVDRTLTGAVALNSLRYASGSNARIITLSAGSTLALDVGFIANSSATTTFAATNSTNTITGTAQDLYFYVNGSTVVIEPALVGASSIVANGGATLSLRPKYANNTYSGGTFANAGTLNLQGAAGRAFTAPTLTQGVFGGATIPATSAVVTMTSTTGLTSGMILNNANYPAGTTILSVDSGTQVTLSAASTNIAEATAQSLVAPSSAVVTLPTTAGLYVGMVLTNANYPAGTTILSVDSGTQVTLSNASTATSAQSAQALVSTLSFYAIPGDLTIENGTVSMGTTPGQVAESANLTIKGSGSFTFGAYTTGPSSFLQSVTFLNEGGANNPTFSLGTPTTTAAKVILTSATPITATNDSYSTTPTISAGSTTLALLQFSNANPTITVNHGLAEVGLNISASISQHASMVSLTKAGNGILALSAAESTFTTGINLSAGGLMLGAGSTGTPVTKGPLGTGTLTIGNGTSLLSDGTARSVANAVTVNGDFTFGGVVAGNNVTLAGAINLGAAGRTITVTSPAVTATLSGALTSTATGAALTKSGAGILVLSSTASSLGGAGVTVANGILKLGATGAIPVSSAITINAGAGLDLGGFNLDLTTQTVTSSGFITNSASSTSTIQALGTSATDVTSTTDASLGLTLVDNYLANASSKLGVTKGGLGTLTFTNTTSLNSGNILVVAGKVVGSAANTFSPNATIVLGNASTATAATPTATLDVLTFDQTIGGIATGTNTAGSSAIVRIGAGRTLTTTGTNTLGSNISATDVSKVNFTDGGVFVANGALFQVGGATGITNGSTLTVDMTALASFTVNSGSAGIFRLGDQTGDTNGGAATMILSQANTIAANLIGIGDTSSGAKTHTLKLGSGTNILNANTITLGGAPVSNGRASGILVFNEASGSVKIRSLADPINGRANLNMAFMGGATGGPITADFNVTGHSADLRFDVMQLAQRIGTATGGATATFSFDTGTLDANDLLLGYKVATAASTTATMTLSGTGTSTFNSATNAMRIGVNAGTSATATGILNISGGTVTVTGNAGTAIKLGDASAAGGTAAGTINLTGGTLTVTGDIIRGATTGTSTAVLNLDGGTLDLSGNDIGGNGSNTGNLTATTFASGTLKNVGQINNGAAITKTGANTLTVAGTAAYTGATMVSAGTLVLSSTSSSTSGITINGGTGTVLQVTSAAASGVGMLGVAMGATTPTIKLTIDGGGTIALPNSFGGNSGIVTTFYVDNNGGTGTNGIVQLNGTTSSGLGNATVNVTGANGYSMYIASLANSAGALGTITFNPTTAALELGNLSVFRATGTGTFVLGGTNAGSKVSGVISDGSGIYVGGTSAITKNGTGTWTLTGANTYTGATLVSAGTLSAASGALAGTSGITVNGATLTAADFKSGATLTLDATGKATITAVGQNVGAVTNANATDTNALNFTASTGIITLASLSGAGQTTFGSDATVTGGISGGVVNVTGALNAASITGGTHSITGAATVTTVDGGTTSIGGVATITTLTSGTVNLTAATGTVTNVNGGTLTLAGTALTATTGTGSAALTLNASSTAAFSGAGVSLGAVTQANTADDALLFGAATGTVSLTSLGGAGKTRFASNASIGTLSGGTVTVDGSTAAITALNGGNISLGSTALTVSGGTHGGVISGANGSLTKSGPGTLILTGANTFGGGTTISAGTLQLGNGAATGSVAAGDITNAGTFAISRSDDLTFASKITGAGAFTKLSANNLTLTGANDFTGATLVSAGTLTAAAGALAGTSGISVNGAIFAAADYNLAATLALDATATATISTADLIITGAVTNAGTTADALNFSASTGIITLSSLAGAGKTRFGAAADITGGVSEGTVTVVGALGANITGGTVNAGSLAGAVSGGNVTVTNLLTGGVSAGTVTAGSLTGNVSGGAVTLTGALTGNVLAGAGTVSAGSMTGDVGSSVTVSGLLTGAITAGTNSLGSLSSASVTGGTNTITGAATVTTVTGGTTTVGGVATITTLTTGTLNLNGATSSIGTLTAGTVNLGTTALTVNDGTFAGLLSGANGSLIKVSAGILTLTGANTFGGGTTISAGELIIGNLGSLGSGAVTVASGATLNLNNLGVANAITVATGGFILGGPDASAVVTTGSSSVDTVLTGNGGLSKSDGGNLTLTTPNFYTGATAASGATAVIKAAFLSDTSSSLGASSLTDPANLTLGSGATLEFNGSSNTSTARSFTVGGSAGIAATGTGTLEFTSSSILATTGTAPALKLTANNTGTNRFAPTLDTNSTALATLAIDGTGVWVIGTGANRFKGDIRIDAGAGSTIGLENASLPSGATLAVANNATVRWEAGNTTGVKLEIVAGTAAKLDLGSNNVVFSNAPVVASGSGTTATFEKQGSGTLTIAASVDASSFNFTLPANSGMLSVGTGGSIGNVSLATGSKLGGTGTVGNVTASSGSTVGPGNSPGTLGGTTIRLDGGSIFEWQVQDAKETTVNPGYDRIALSGNLDLTFASKTNKITLKVVSLLGNGDGTTLGNPLNFDAPAGASSIRVFNFATVAGDVLLNANEQISDVFTFDVSQFKYSDGSTSNAGLWSIDWNSANGAITLTAVPEPSTYGFGLGALALAAAAIRRRRKRQATKA